MNLSKRPYSGQAKILTSNFKTNSRYGQEYINQNEKAILR